MNVGSVVRARRSIRTDTTTTSGSSVSGSRKIVTSESQHDFIDITQRAVIATIDQYHNTKCSNDNNSSEQLEKSTNVCLLWETGIPTPITMETPFIITPNIDNDTRRDDEIDDVEETEHFMESLLPLYPFELDGSMKLSFSDDNDSELTLINRIQRWKECGDTLYQIRDVVAAIPYYEYALHLTNNGTTTSCANQQQQFKVGATVFIKDTKGYIVAAEIDCIEDDIENVMGNYRTCSSLDVTVIETSTERTIQSKDILLCWLHFKEKDNNINSDIQVRILLNLSRSLLQQGNVIAALPNHKTSNTTTPTNYNEKSNIKATSDLAVRYRKSVVLATSLSLAIIKLLRQQQCTMKESVTGNDNDGRNTNGDTAFLKLESSALLIRAKAQYQLNKMTHATADLQRILQQQQSNTSNKKEAQQLLRQIQLHQKHVTKTNQRLAKNVSQWIQTTLRTTDSSGSDRDGNPSINNNTKDDVSNNKVCSSSSTNRNIRTVFVTTSESRSVAMKPTSTTTRPIHAGFLKQYLNHALSWISLLVSLTLAVVAAYLMQHQRGH